MTQTFESWLDFTVSQKVSPADTTIYISPVPTVTAGRVYLKNPAQEEWISFTWVWATSITGCTRWLSSTADPATSGTGLTWVAWSKGVLVAMHDQLPDKQQWDAVLFSAKVYATTAARDSALWADWAATKAYTWIYVTATWLHYNYNLSSNQWESVDTGTTTPDATTTAAGKVELPTDAEVTAGTATGGTGATLTPTNAQTLKSISLKTAVTDISTSDNFVVQDASDSDKDKKVTGTLTREFMNMKEFTAWENLTAGDLVAMYTDGSVRKTIKSATAAAQLSTITGLDTGTKPVQTIYLSTDKAVVFYQKSADNIVYARVITFAQRTPTVWEEQAVSSATVNDGTFSTVALSSSLFVVAFNKNADDKIYAVACTVSWIVITAGTEVDMSDWTTLGWSTGTSICKLSATKFVVWRLQATASDPRVNAWSVSGTTITAWSSAALEATTAGAIPLLAYVQDDVIVTFYDDGTNVRHVMVTYSGTTPTVKTATTTVAGGLNNGEAKVVSVGNWIQILFKFTSLTWWWVLKAIPIMQVDQNTWWQPGTYDSTQVYDIYLDTATTNYWDISYLGNNIFALLSVIDGLNDVRLRLLERTFNGFIIIDTKTIATTCTYPSCCALTDSMDKVFIAWKNGADLYYSVYRDNSQQFVGVVKTTTSAAGTVPVNAAWDAAITSLTRWLTYYVGDAGVVATTGTKRIGVATSTTNLFLN